MRVGDIAGCSEWSECLNVDVENTRTTTRRRSESSSDEVMELLIYLRHLESVWVLINIFLRLALLFCGVCGLLLPA